MKFGDLIADALVEQAQKQALWRLQARKRAADAESRTRNVYPLSVLFLDDADREKIVNLHYQAICREESTGIPFEVDHIIPLSRGGAHLPRNLQVVTASYNRSKGANLFGGF